MKVYVTGKVEGYTKKTLKEYIESKGHEFKSFSKSTNLLIVAERPGAVRLVDAKSWGIETMPWAEFEAKYLS